MSDLQISIIVSSLVAILFGSVAASVISHILTTRWSIREYKLRKLEELYKANDSFGTAFTALMFSTMTVLTGMTDFDFHKEAVKNTGGDADDYRNLQMIVNIYFIELKPHLNALKESWNKASEIYGQFIVRVKNNKEYKSLASPLKQHVDTFNEKRQLFESAIFERSSQLQSNKVLEFIRDQFYNG